MGCCSCSPFRTNAGQDQSTAQNVVTLWAVLEHIAVLGVFYWTSNFQQMLTITPTSLFCFQYICCKTPRFRFIGCHSKIGPELRILTPALLFLRILIAVLYIWHITIHLQTMQFTLLSKGRQGNPCFQWHR